MPAALPTGQVHLLRLTPLTPSPACITDPLAPCAVPVSPSPQLVAALIQAKERGDPQGWLAFQSGVSELKLQRSRLEREAEDVAAVLEAALQRERQAGEYDEYEEAVGKWDGAQAGRRCAVLLPAVLGS